MSDWQGVYETLIKVWKISKYNDIEYISNNWRIEGKDD